MLARYFAPGLTTKQRLEWVTQHAQAARDHQLSTADVDSLDTSMVRVVLPAQGDSPAPSFGVAAAAVARCKVLQQALEASNTDGRGPIAVDADPAAFVAWRAGPTADATECLARAAKAAEVRLLLLSPTVCVCARSMAAARAPPSAASQQLTLAPTRRQHAAPPVVLAPVLRRSADVALRSQGGQGSHVMQFAHKADTPLELWPSRFWASATCPREPSRLTAAAATLLDAAPEELLAAICAAHPALLSATAPLLTVLASVPPAVDVAACQRACSAAAHGPGAGAPLLHVHVSAEHKRAQCERLAAAMPKLAPDTSIALTCDPRGLRVVEPLREQVRSQGRRGVVSVTFLPGKECAAEQAALLHSCSAGLRAVTLQNVLTQGRADRLRRVVTPGGASANRALEAVSVLASLEHLTLNDNVLTEYDAQMLEYSLTHQLKQLRSFTWVNNRHSEGQTAALLRDCMRGLGGRSRLDTLAITGTAMTCTRWGQAVGWAHIAPELERMAHLTHLSLARTRSEGVHVLGLGMPGEINAAAAARALIPAVGTLACLRTLDMSGMGCSDSAAALAHDLAAALPGLHKLRSLVFDENKLAVAQHPGAAAGQQPACVIGAELCAACVTLTELTRLGLAQCSLDATAASAAAFFAALASLHSLRYLDLARNPFQSTSALLPLTGLRHLRHLGLHECQLRRPGFDALADGLRALTALSLLDLSFNDILQDEQLDACAAQLRLRNDGGVMYGAEAAASREQ